MKQFKKHTYITLFSVGLLTSQFFVTPILLAEENDGQQENHYSNQNDHTNDYIDELSSETEPSITLESEIIEETEGSAEASSPETMESIPQQEATTGSENSSDESTESSDDFDHSVDDDENDTDKEESSNDSQDKDDLEDENTQENDSSIPPIESEEKNEDNSNHDNTQEKDHEISESPEDEIKDNVQETSPKPSPSDKIVAPIVQSPSELPTVEGFFNGDSMVDISEAFRASEVTESSLLGFTLPLLKEYDEEWQAALIYEIIRQIGEEISTGAFEDWVKDVFELVMNEKTELSEEITITADDLKAGDLLYGSDEERKKIEGIYLSDDYKVIGKEEFVDDESNSQKYVLGISRIDVEETLVVRRIKTATLTEEGEDLLKNYPAPFDFTQNEATQSFIDELAQEAQKLGQEYDVFASVLIAQAILESGSGTSGLSRSPYHNLFGIKGSYKGNSVVLPTMEDKGNGELFEIQSAFRSYNSYRDSMADYIALIRGGITGNPTFYQDVWRSEAQNYLRATDALTGSYATDTTYNKKLNSLIAAYGLTKYDQAIGSETGIFIQGEDQIPNEYRELMKLPRYNGKDYNVSGSYPVGQCTWYVFNRVNQLGGTVDDYMGNGGQWGATGRRLGYKVSQTPRAGSMISFAPGTAGSDPRYGHVAFVEAVGQNGILISEGNVYGGTTISYRVISNDLALSSHVTYIMPK